MGAPVMLARRTLPGLRQGRVNQFDRSLIFDLPCRDGVSIVSVPHAAPAWWRFLGVQFQAACPERGAGLDRIVPRPPHLHRKPNGLDTPR